MSEDMNSQGPENPNEKSSTGLDNNVAALLSYLLGFITGLVFFLLEKKSDYVRFHAMQSTVLFGGLFVISLVINIIPLLGTLISFLLGILSFVLWIVLMVKSYQGERYKLPIVGDISEDLLKKFS